MNQEASLYIITINYNGAKHTIEMVNSIYNMNYSNFKIIIVDNYSKKEDIKLLETLRDKAIIILSDKNLGFAGGNNIGIKYALEKGADYIMLLNNDTIIGVNSVNYMIECMKRNSADLVCPKILNYYNKKLINYAGGNIVNYKGAVKIDGIGEIDNGQFDQEKSVTFAHGCCMLMSATTIKKVGLLSEEYFLYFEDTDYSSKMINNNQKMMYSPKSIVYHKESVSTKKYSDNYQYYFCRNRLLFIKRNINNPVNKIAYLYTMFYMIKHILKRNFEIKNVQAAIKSFLNNNLGKREILNE